MNSISTNIFVLPALLVIWTIDFYLYLLVLHLTDVRWSLLPTNYANAVAELCAGVLRTAERWLSGRRTLIGIQSIPYWLPWVFVVLCAVFLRLLATWVVSA